MTTQERLYSVLWEQNSDESEDTYYFLRLNGNEEPLRKLAEALEGRKPPEKSRRRDEDDDLYGIDWDDVETRFVLDLEHPVSERTASEMIRLHVTKFLHRKFDGDMQTIPFGIKETDSASRRAKRIAKLLAGGNIDQFIGDEDDTNATDDSHTTTPEHSENDEDDEDDEKKRPKKPSGQKLPSIIEARLKERKKN